jgi:hypothetical protein
MHWATCQCRTQPWERGGKMGHTAALHPPGRDRGAGRLRCTACGQVVSARTGTAEAGSRTAWTPEALGAKRWAAGRGVRAPARLLEVAHDTGQHGRVGRGTQGGAVRAAHVRHRPLTACQVEAWWPCVMQPEAPRTPRERRLDWPGETWVGLACAPSSKLGPAWVAGQRPRPARPMRSPRVPSSPAGPLPWCTSDA